MKTNLLFLSLFLFCGSAGACEKCLQEYVKAEQRHTRSFYDKPKKEEPKIEWLGRVTFTIDTYNAKAVTASRDDIELGLKDDGTVVWRRKEKK
jgi:hypothetical protein